MRKYLCTLDSLLLGNKYIFIMNKFYILSSNPRLHQILKSELRNLIIEFWIFPISSLIGLFKIFEKYFLKNFESTNQRRGRENSKLKKGQTSEGRLAKLRKAGPLNSLNLQSIWLGPHLGFEIEKSEMVSKGLIYNIWVEKINQYHIK